MNSFVRWYSLIHRVLVGWLLRLVYGYRVEGAGNLPQHGGVLVACNHQSFLDPPLVQCALPRLVVFTPRQTLSQHWIYRLLTKCFATVPIQRGKADLAATRRLVDLLRQGEVVAVFPEETRTHDGRLRPVKGGFHLLSSRTGVPVLPMVIEGAYDVWPRGRKLPLLRGRIRVRVGPLLHLEDCSRKEAADRLQQAWLQLGGVPTSEPTAPSLDNPSHHNASPSDGSPADPVSPQGDAGE